jgi:hypothetical protein
MRGDALFSSRFALRFSNKAQILAAFRTLTITLLHCLGYENMAEGIEIFAENKRQALLLVRFGRTECP